MIRFPLNIRVKLFRAGFKVKHQNLKDTPLFVPTDLAILPKIGWKKARWWFESFKKYRKQQGRTTWNGVTGIYPRPFYILYYYLLFWWADYCDVLDNLLQNPEGTYVPELFLCYIIEIDRIIDHPDNKHWLENLADIKFNPRIEKILNVLLAYIRSSQLSRKNKQRICHQLWEYRRICLSTFQDKKPEQESNFSAVLEDKEVTVGNLYYIWAVLLCDFYQLDSTNGLAYSSLEIFRNLGMAIQVLDDTLDWPLDYRAGTDNIFNEYLKETTVEFNLAKYYHQNICSFHLDGMWMEENLPATFKSVTDLLNSYFIRIKAVSQKPSATDELCENLGRAHDHTIGV